MTGFTTLIISLFCGALCGAVFAYFVMDFTWQRVGNGILWGVISAQGLYMLATYKKITR